MNDFEHETFEEITKQFHQWLRQQGISGEIVWLFQKDFTCYKRKWWLRWPLPESNNILAERLFKYGKHQQLGFSLEGLCEVDKKAVCYIWVPQDKVAASYAMLSGARFAMQTDPPEPILVSNPIRWKLMKELNRIRHRNYLELELPKEANLVHDNK